MDDAEKRRRGAGGIDRFRNAIETGLRDDRRSHPSAFTLRAGQRRDERARAANGRPLLKRRKNKAHDVFGVSIIINRANLSVTAREKLVVGASRS